MRLNAIIDCLTGIEDITWSRVVMRRECHEIINRLCPDKLSALEISGSYWKLVRFAQYKSLSYPEFDICRSALEQKFDLIVAEQVFEHLLWPYRAGRNVHQMLRPGGHFLVSVPFLMRIHEVPVDCTRWTETGLKYFLAECGFELDGVRTGSWGNRSCIKANFGGYVRYRPRVHSLKNESNFPFVVWALARKAS